MLINPKPQIKLITQLHVFCSFLTEAGSGSSKGRNVCSTQLSFQDLGQESVGYLSRQQQHSFLGNEFGCSSPVVPPPPQTQHHQPKQENQQQSLLPFFDEWPKTKDSWFDIEDEKPNRTASFSTTQLSMSTPIASSDYSTTSSRSLTGNNELTHLLYQFIRPIN